MDKKQCKLSVLFCTCNNIPAALEHIRSLWDIADDFVVIDQSSLREKAMLRREVKRQKLDKIQIYDAVALGFQEPLRMYGLGKCKNDWVLHLDVDERLTDELRDDIPRMINSTSADAFAIRRYEHVVGGKRTAFFTWQIRIYRRSMVLYKGILHEPPIVKGRIKKIDDDAHYIRHDLELKVGAQVYGYDKIHRLDERLSYHLYKQKLEELLSRQLAVGSKNPRESFTGRIVLSWLSMYEKLTFRKEDEEITNFDYFAFLMIRDLGYAVRERSFGIFFRAFFREFGHMKDFDRWRHGKDGKEEFEISKIINDIGTIRFLHLDRESQIRALNKTYWGKKQGIDLQILLLKQRYRSLVDSRIMPEDYRYGMHLKI